MGSSHLSLWHMNWSEDRWLTSFSWSLAMCLLTQEHYPSGTLHDDWWWLMTLLKRMSNEGHQETQEYMEYYEHNMEHMVYIYMAASQNVKPRSIPWTHRPIHTPDPYQNAGDPDRSIRLDHRGPIHTRILTQAHIDMYIYIYVYIYIYMHIWDMLGFNIMEHISYTYIYRVIWDAMEYVRILRDDLKGALIHNRMNSSNQPILEYQPISNQPTLE